jgi:hypothetical protein
MLHEPSFHFEAGQPEDHRQPVSPDAIFLRACGVRPPDVRDELRYWTAARKRGVSEMCVGDYDESFSRRRPADSPIN